MRVAFVTHGYPRWDGDVAGVFIERLARALVVRGHQVLVLAPADEGRAGEAERGGVTVRRLRYAPARWETLAYRGTMAEAVRRPRGLLAAVGLVRALRRGLARADAAERIDVVHAHWWVPSGVAAMLAQGAPYVVTLHGTDVAVLGRSAVARALARRVLQRAAAVTAVSSFLAQRAGEWTGLDPASVRVQPMPIAAPPPGGAGPGGGGIVTVGRLTVQKRTDLVLEAVARLGSGGTPPALTIVGDGPERGNLERRAAELGIVQRTRFLGMVAPDRLPAVIATADVMAFPAVGEGYGLAAAEALMLGIPVVVMEDGGGVLDVVPARGAGRVVPAGDASALAAALAELAADPESRLRAAEQGGRLRARLAPAAVAAAFEQVYRDAGRGRR